MNQDRDQAEVERLENLWSGEFGNAYLERNRMAGEKRGPFWESLLREFPVKRVLEVGCNRGANLSWIASHVAPRDVYGVDVNEAALIDGRASVPGANLVWSRGRDLPFRDRWFDLVLTAGVLIHQPDDTLPLVMSEIVRCSRQYVFCGEYFAESPTEVPYRGQRGALIKRNYGQLYQQLFPELSLLRQGELNTEQGWDRLTYWLLAKA
jgi:pseudaminic acid biosynthesis-associated methylase